MRLVFMGTAAFAVPSLEALISAGHDLAGVFTQPDRRAGRGQRVRGSPVKQAALSRELQVHQPDSLKADQVEGVFARLAPELLVVVAYGKIIPKWLREFPGHGAVNVHGSLLPRYRGAAPVNWAIARGESTTGVCTMVVDAGLDTGAVYDCESTRIGEDETAPELSRRLSELGASLLVRTIESIRRGTAVGRPQDDERATLAPRLRKADGRIRWEQPARTIHNEVRAFVPWPAVVVGFRGVPCRILRTRRTPDVMEPVDPGRIAFRDHRLSVCCGDGALLEIVEIQMENRKAVAGADFAHGVRLSAEDRFTAIDAESGA